MLPHLKINALLHALYLAKFECSKLPAVFTNAAKTNQL